MMVHVNDTMSTTGYPNRVLCTREICTITDVKYCTQFNMNYLQHFIFPFSKMEKMRRGKKNLLSSLARFYTKEGYSRFDNENINGGAWNLEYLCVNDYSM